MSSFIDNLAERPEKIEDGGDFLSFVPTAAAPVVAPAAAVAPPAAAPKQFYESLGLKGEAAPVNLAEIIAPTTAPAVATPAPIFDTAPAPAPAAPTGQYKNWETVDDTVFEDNPNEEGGFKQKHTPIAGLEDLFQRNEYFNNPDLVKSLGFTGNLYDTAQSGDGFSTTKLSQEFRDWAAANNVSVSGGEMGDGKNIGAGLFKDGVPVGPVVQWDKNIGADPFMDALMMLAVGVATGGVGGFAQGIGTSLGAGAGLGAQALGTGLINAGVTGAMGGDLKQSLTAGLTGAAGVGLTPMVSGAVGTLAPTGIPGLDTALTKAATGAIVGGVKAGISGQDVVQGIAAGGIGSLASSAASSLKIGDTIGDGLEKAGVGEKAADKIVTGVNEAVGKVVGALVTGGDATKALGDIALSTAVNVVDPAGSLGLKGKAGDAVNSLVSNSIKNGGVNPIMLASVITKVVGGSKTTDKSGAGSSEVDLSGDDSGGDEEEVVKTLPATGNEILDRVLVEGGASDFNADDLADIVSQVKSSETPAPLPPTLDTRTPAANQLDRVEVSGNKTSDVDDFINNLAASTDERFTTTPADNKLDRVEVSGNKTSGVDEFGNSEFTTVKGIEDIVTPADNVLDRVEVSGDRYIDVLDPVEVTGKSTNDDLTPFDLPKDLIADVPKVPGLVIPETPVVKPPVVKPPTTTDTTETPFDWSKLFSAGAASTATTDPLYANFTVKDFREYFDPEYKAEQEAKRTPQQQELEKLLALLKQQRK